MYKATLETRNFTFEAYGKSQNQALKSLTNGLNDHAQQYELRSDWWHWLRTDIYIKEVVMGSCYRDNERIAK